MGSISKKNIRKKNLGTYPYASVLFSITLALFVMGIFGLILIYSQELEKAVRNNVKIQVYLKSQITEVERKKIEKVLAAKPYMVKNSTLQFVSKEEAAKFKLNWI